MQEMGRALEQQKRSLDSLHAEKRDMSQQIESQRLVAGSLEQASSEQGRALLKVDPHWPKRRLMLKPPPWIQHILQTH